MNATKKNNGFYEEVSENGYMLPQIQKIKADYNNRLTQIEEDFKKTKNQALLMLLTGMILIILVGILILVVI